MAKFIKVDIIQRDEVYKYNVELRDYYPDILTHFADGWLNSDLVEYIYTDIKGATRVKMRGDKDAIEVADSLEFLLGKLMSGQ